MKRFFINSTNILDAILFIARIVTVILFIILITIYFSQPAHSRSLNPFILPLYEAIMVISFYVALGGLLIAWSTDGYGGFLTIAALICFSVVDYFYNGKILWNIWIIAIPAFLYIIYWWYTNVSENYDIYRS